MAANLKKQAEQLYETFAELVRRYQFRDREEVCCHGLSVSQCYTLEVILAHGAMTMGALADHLFLKISSVTRVVDGLVERGWAARVPDERDRRVWLVTATKKGAALVSKIRSDLVEEQVQMLRKIPPANRKDVLSAMEYLLTAFKERSSKKNKGDRRPS